MTSDEPDTQATASAEAPRIAGSVPDTASTSASDIGPDGEEVLQPKPKSKRQKSSKSESNERDQGPPSEAESPATRILKPLALPAIAMDRRLFPAALIKALDAAALGDETHLPAAIFMSLAAIGAIVGSNLRIEAASELKTPANLSLRVVALTPDRGPALVPPALLAGAHAVETDWIKAHAAAVERNVEERRTAERQRRLYETARKSAVALGIDLPPSAPDVTAPDTGPRPQLVVENGASSAIQTAAAGGTGLLVIRDEHMPSMDRVGGHYDPATDRILNAAAAGHLVALKDAKRGCVSMRPLTASVVGVLELADCAGLHAAGTSQLAATVFVAATVPPIAPDCAPIVALLRAVAAIPPGTLRVRVSTEALSALKAWIDLAETAQPPLSDFFHSLEDLAMRVAAAMHVVVMAAGPNQTSREIPAATLVKAIAVVDRYVVPIAREVLGPISRSAAERNARRIVGYARERTSGANPILNRRDLLRAWQRSMDVPALDAALALLVQEGALAALDPVDAGGGGQRFRVEPVVLETA